MFYLKLQLKILNRRLIDFGLPLIVGYVLVFFAFYIVSNTLLNKLDPLKFKFIYLILSFIITSRLGEIDKNDFLKAHLSKVHVLKIRFTENVVVSIPFLVFLVIHHMIKAAIILLVINCLSCIISFKNKLNITIPTPFSKHPFEYPIGFRKNYGIYFFAYFLTFSSIYSGNINLGVFALVIVFFVSMSFYSNSESTFYVWIYSCNSEDFLDKKIKIIVKYTLFLSLPILFFLITFFFEDVFKILFIQILGVLYITTSMLGKYSVFPSRMGLKQSLGVFLSILMPPLLLLIIPYFYKQSQKRLKEIL